MKQSPIAPRMRTFASSPVWVSILVMTVAVSLTYTSNNDVAVVTDSMTRNLSKAEILSSTPVVNRLEAPDTSTVTPDTEGGPHPAGARIGDRIFHSPFGPRAFGTFGIPYTTTRVQEGNMTAAGVTSANRLSASQPYRAIGKLTFLVGTQPSHCTATLIRRSVIVTAAHCVQFFGYGSSMFTNFAFRPGHYGAAGATAAQIAPYGTWNSIKVVRPASWADGTDIGSGAARDNDLAVIALGKNAAGQFVGNLVESLGWGWNNYGFVTSAKTGNLRTAAVSTLGYPALMDGGLIMQRTDGPTYTTTVGGAGQLQQGSNFTGGSSGGPWIVNFSGRNAVLSGGAVVGTSVQYNRCWRDILGNVRPQRAEGQLLVPVPSELTISRFLWRVWSGQHWGAADTLCNSAAPGGGTLASKGYCS